MRIAIIGSGISGSLAARLLASEHEIELFESGDYPGGHANTVDVLLDGQLHAVDTGFMVFNTCTYPNFCRLLKLLEVESQPSDMSFSVRSSCTGLEYQGSSLNGVFAQRRNLFRPHFLRMLADIVRFNNLGSAAVAEDTLVPGTTVGDFLKQCRVKPWFVENYLRPMAAAIWSCRPESLLQFPAKFLLTFFANHGLMQLRDRPQWRTVVGGSRCYLDALLRPIAAQLRLRSPVESIARTSHGVWVTSRGSAPEQFDEVVLATHADQSLRLLAEPTSLERRILRAFPYQRNEAVLHTDQRMLPLRRRAWASWNYRISSSTGQAPSVTYDLSRLQRLSTSTPLLLTLNESHNIDPSTVLRTFRYHHPAYTCDSLRAQQAFSTISGVNRTHYCGAYWGCGFHEDGVNSALAVTRHFGIELEACKAAYTKASSATIAANR